MWKIILSGLVMLNAQPNDSTKPRYDGAEKVHVLLVDARQVAVDSEGEPIAQHAAVLEAPTSCLAAGTSPDWKMTLADGDRSFFLLDDVRLSFRPALASSLEPVIGRRIIENDGKPRMLPCCLKGKEDCDGVHPDFLCEEGAGDHAYAEQRRDLTWATPMADLGGDGKLAWGCLPPIFSTCPVVAWFTITSGGLETYRLEREDAGNPKIGQVLKTTIKGSETARAAAREVLWTLPAGQLEVSLNPFRGGPSRRIVLTESCPQPEITIHNSPLESIFSGRHEHAAGDHEGAGEKPVAAFTPLSERHAEHLFRLLASPPSTLRTLVIDGNPAGTGLCPPGDAGGP